MKIDSFVRIHDNEYLIKFENKREKYIVHCPTKMDIALANEILSKALENIPEAQWEMLTQGKGYLQVNDQYYKLTPHVTRLENLLPKLTASIQKRNPIPTRVELDFNQVSSLTKVREDTVVSFIPLSEEDKSIIWKVDPKAFYIDDNSEKDLFQDPYTQLAAHAMQKYVSNYSEQDIPADPNPVIIAQLNEKNALPTFVLVHKNNVDPSLYISNSQTIEKYFQSLVKMWGKEKVDEIAHRFGIDVAKMMENNEPLTPQIVQRMNVGLASIKMQDVERIHHFITSLRNDPRWLQADNNQPLSDFAKNFPEVPTIYWNKLLPTNPTVGILKQMLGVLNYLETPDIRTLKHTAFNYLVSLINLSPAERELSYTGHKLEGFIDSPYTIAGVDIYKPWVDQQELNQCCDNLTGNTSWEYFAEQLAFVVCKKHLVHTHPSLKYTVGSLIPGPVDQTGQKHWYRVSSCINSGTGNLSYTLEPASNDPSIPVIKLFRSTASDPYNMDSAASVKSDINPINSPGYEGRSFIENYEAPFFKERTIPIWVGYHHLAEQALNQAIQAFNNNTPPSQETLDHIDNLLQKSAESFLIELSERAHAYDLGEILSKYDDVLIKMLSSIPFEDSLAILKIVKRHSKPGEPNYSQSFKDAQLLLEVAQKTIPDEGREFIDDINNHLLQSNEYLTKRTEEVNELKRRYFMPLVPLTDDYTAGRSTNEPEILLANLMQRSNILKQLAIARDEDITKKKPQNILCIGHSLGGALAQRTFAQYCLNSSRIPLPGHTMELYDFDAPGINMRDVVRFTKQGNAHSQLLQDLNKPITIHRRYAAGDFFPLGGDASVGATFTHEDAIAVSQWLNFDAAVQRILPTATRETLFATRFVHGTQFSLRQGYQEVVEATNDVALHVFDTKIQGQFSTAIENDPERIKLLNQIWKIDPLALNIASYERRLAFFRGFLRSEQCYKFPKPEEQDHPLHGEWWKYRDSKGVFCVTEQGPILANS